MWNRGIQSTTQNYHFLTSPTTGKPLEWQWMLLSQQSQLDRSSYDYGAGCISARVLCSQQGNKFFLSRLKVINKYIFLYIYNECLLCIKGRIFWLRNRFITCLLLPTITIIKWVSLPSTQGGGGRRNKQKKPVLICMYICKLYIIVKAYEYTRKQLITNYI